MACRSLERAEKAKADIIERLKGQPGQDDIAQRLVIKRLDLASLKSVREFSEDILQNETRVDVLINNAGLAGYPERTLTEDGLEITMASNHFGHFLLTNLLLPILKKSAPSRIIVLSSSVHRRVRSFDLDNLNSEKVYHKSNLYFVTKLVNIYFVRHLAKQLEGSGVIVNAVHPGLVDTDFFKMMPKVVMFLLRPVFLCFAKSPIQGAQTSVCLAASDAPEVLVNGRYFADLKEEEITPLAKDEAIPEKVWAISEKLTGLSKD